MLSILHHIEGSVYKSFNVINVINYDEFLMPIAITIMLLVVIFLSILILSLFLFFFFHINDPL